MKVIKMTPRQRGVLARQRVARSLEKTLLVLVTEIPGMSVYELSRKIKRNPSTVHSAIQRLANGNEIVTKTIVRKKGIVKRVYPRNFEFPDSHVITIPKNAIHVENPTWQNAYVYQLNSESIGISGEPVPEWSEITKPIIEKVRRQEEGFEVTLPSSLHNFYRLGEKETMLAFVNNKAILTITGIQK